MKAPTTETEPTALRGLARSRVTFGAAPGLAAAAGPLASDQPLRALPARRQGLRVAALAVGGALVFFGLVLLAYELAVARVPQHRAALERIVRAQTGLDVRFSELGLRWGWYGPEAVFRRVELGEPGRSTVLLRAPELSVGFDAWSTLRSGQLEAGRITLIAPDIDFERVGLGVGAGADDGRGASGRLRGHGSSRDGASPNRALIFKRWQGGRVDIEGGTLRLPDPGGSANPLTVQIRHASLRRSASEWSGYGLVFLPERLGRTARIVMRLDGDLEKPASLSGSVRFEGRRLLLAGWRELLGAMADAAPGAAQYLPRAGGGDVAVNVDFEKGRLVKADGKVSVGGLEFEALGGGAAGTERMVSTGAQGMVSTGVAGAVSSAVAGVADQAARGVLKLDRVRGEWRLAHRGGGWRLQVDSLELGDAASHVAPATLALDAGSSGDWVRGKLERAPLQPVMSVARWLAPQLDLAGVELGGVVRDVAFDWNSGRPVGQRLQAAARLENVAVSPPSHAFALTGLAGRVAGVESDLVADLEAGAARLEFGQSPQHPLDDVRVAARLQISRVDSGWRVLTEKLELQHENTHLRISGTLTGSIASGAAAGRAQAVSVAAGRAQAVSAVAGRAQAVSAVAGRAQAVSVAAGRAQAGRAQAVSVAAGRAQAGRAQAVSVAAGRAQAGRAQVVSVASARAQGVSATRGRVPEISARAELTGADVPFLEKLAGAGMVQALGATFSHLTAGRVEHAQVELHGALDETLALRDNGGGFTGSAILRDATLSGGDLWPDAQGVDARIDWRGARIRAAIEKGRAGSFVLASAKAEWDARGEQVAHITGRVAGRLEEAVAWVRDHPALQEYAPRVQNVDLRGDGQLEFNLTLPAVARGDVSDGARAASAGAARGEVPDGARAAVAGVTRGAISGVARQSAVGRIPDIEARVTAVLDGARLQAVAGVPAIEGVRGSIVYDAGHLRRSTLTGTWLGGPVTLNVGERREHGALVLAIQGRGQLDARQLVLAAAGGIPIDDDLAPAGKTEWTGELAYLAGTNAKSAQWRVKADSTLVGIASRLPEPLAKTAGVAVPLHIEVQGADATAELRVNLGDRVRSVLSLRRRADVTWQVERGGVRFGTTPATLPSEPVVFVEGRVRRLDLPAYVAAWQQLREDPTAPAVRAELVAGKLLAAGHTYSEVTVLAARTSAGADLQLHSPDIAGMAHWPAVASAAHPAQFHFARLSVPAGAAFNASAELIAALGTAAELSVEDLVWAGHSIGRATATIASGGDSLDVTDLRLTGETQQVNGTVHCQTTACRLKFNLDSSDAAATLEAFGFRPDVTAARAVLDGDLEWNSGSGAPVLATLTGQLSMRLDDGTTRAVGEAGGGPFALLSVPALVSGVGQRTAQNVSLGSPALGAGAVAVDGGAGAGADADAPAQRRDGRYAEVRAWGSAASGSKPRGDALAESPGDAHAGSRGDALAESPGDAHAGSRGDALAESLGDAHAESRGDAHAESRGDRRDGLRAPRGVPPNEARELRFSRLEADFQLQGGEASTSNLHLDGDAEILMRGRTGLVARDYDQQVWILRGEGRLPAAVRRLGPTPRIAAAWLSLRELFGGGGGEDGNSKATLRLQGSWDDPIVVVAE